MGNLEDALEEANKKGGGTGGGGLGGATGGGGGVKLQSGNRGQSPEEQMAGATVPEEDESGQGGRTMPTDAGTARSMTDAE